MIDLDGDQHVVCPRCNTVLWDMGLLVSEWGRSGANPSLH